MSTGPFLTQFQSKAARSRLIARAHRIAAEIDQIFLDAEAWNARNPGSEPIDPDPDGALAKMRAGLVRVK